MLNTGFTEPLSAHDRLELECRARAARASVLTATTVAASGHPGGSLSSMEILTVLYGCARLHPHEPRWPERDRIVVSHGHVSPGVYAALAGAGFYSVAQFEAHFRQSGSVFEGHVERSVPGVEWSTGNLGQGLSAGVGLALGARLTGGAWRTYVAMSDGEQMKGQIAEARRLAAKESLGSLTAVVDWNHIQISGRTEEVMPVNLPALWSADGWTVYECDAHDVAEVYAAIAAADNDDAPSVVLARSVIGKGVSFMEGEAEYHGRALVRDEYLRAMAELEASPEAIGSAVVRRSSPCTVVSLAHETPAVELVRGIPRTYEAGEKVDNRSAWGAALLDLARVNSDQPIVVFDCDLRASVKTDGFATERPDMFVQCGVGEHNVATASGALSTVPGTVALWSDFGVFAIDESYNQQRMNDVNGAGVKLAVTHCGLDVGEDGKTHQCLDYVGAFRELFGWRVIVPADANQTDRVVREVACMQGCVAVAMGRSKLPVILAEDGSPLFGGDYRFEYGKVVWARAGEDGCVLTYGSVAPAVVAAADALRDEGIHVAVGVAACPLNLEDDDARAAASGGWILTVEDHNVRTGLGATVAEWIAASGESVSLHRLGVSGYQSSGSAEALLRRCGLDVEGITAGVRRALGSD